MEDEKIYCFLIASFPSIFSWNQQKGNDILFCTRGVKTNVITKMKTTSFPNIYDETWKKAAIQTLRAVTFDELITKTPEGITLLPLYTKEKEDKQIQNKQKKMIQTIRSGIRSPDCTIAQQMYVTNSKQFIQEVKESIEKGNEAIVYDGSHPVQWEET